MAEKYPVNLQAEEEVIAVLHRHPASLVVSMAGTIIVSIIILVILIMLSTSDILNFLDPLWNLLIAVVIIGALLSLGLDFFRYRNDVWMITNQRIVDAARNNPFRQDVSTASLANIQDMNISRRGVLATIFKFGDVTCQTASQSSQLTFKGVAEPDKVLEMIDRQRAQIHKPGTSAPSVDAPVEANSKISPSADEDYEPDSETSSE